MKYDGCLGQVLGDSAQCGCGGCSSPDTEGESCRCGGRITNRLLARILQRLDDILELLEDRLPPK